MMVYLFIQQQITGVCQNKLSFIIFQLKDGSKSLSQLEKEINGITQKMLLEQLRELRNFGIIDKVKSEGYPLHVEYFLTEDKGMEILKAIKIMQNVGIDYMIENGMEQIIKEKDIKKYNVQMQLRKGLLY